MREAWFAVMCAVALSGCLSDDGAAGAATESSPLGFAWPEDADIMALRFTTDGSPRQGVLVGGLTTEWAGDPARQAQNFVEPSNTSQRPAADLQVFLVYTVNETTGERILWREAPFISLVSRSHSLAIQAPTPLGPQGAEFTVGGFGGGGGVRVAYRETNFTLYLEPGVSTHVVMAATNRTQARRLPEVDLVAHLDPGVRVEMAAGVDPFLVYADTPDFTGTMTAVSGQNLATDSFVTRSMQPSEAKVTASGEAWLGFYPWIFGDEAQAEYRFEGPGTDVVATMERTGGETQDPDCRSGCHDLQGPYGGFSGPGDWSLNIDAADCITGGPTGSDYDCRGFIGLLDLGLIGPYERLR